ncbi:MAG: hypothetical protein KAR20_09925 [Candidatus Heimdallarchaeota archaeon]|nr:hypothetical protein [Candidatus Heimdallarchaeota archaeon]
MLEERKSNKYSSNIHSDNIFKISPTDQRWPAGEFVGKVSILEKRIPVLSCGGASILGEIARLAANILAKKEGFSRNCYGEPVTLPESEIAKWIRGALKILVIEGCHLRCQSRILENAIESEKLQVIDASLIHKKFKNIFDVDRVPETERLNAAEDVVNSVLGMQNPISK